MNILEQLSSHIFPSEPTIGHIGSLDFNIWLAQISGVPILGLKKESLGLKLILLFYGIPVITLVTFIYTGCEIYDLALSWSSLDALTQNTCLSLTHIAGVTKTVNTFYRLSDIIKVIEKLKYVTKKYVVSDEQRQAFFRGELENKIMLMVYASLVGFTGCLGMVMLFYNPEGVAGKIFPYRVKFPEWLPYQLQLVYMGCAVLLFALQIVAIDYMNVTMINQIRFQLIILNLSFDKLMLDGQSVSFMTTMSKLGDPNDRLHAIVQHHCVLNELRNEVENIFRAPILIQFFTSVVIFAMTGFQATVRSGGDNVLIYFYCGCIFCELFLYCWFGNDVFEQSKTLSTRGFGSSWYQFDHRFKKSLLIFLANAQRPFLFTAGGFMALSLPSFAGILSKSYSYIAVLRQLYGR